MYNQVNRVGVDIANMLPVLEIHPLIGPNRAYPMTTVSNLISARTDAQFNKTLGTGTYGTVVRRRLDLVTDPRPKLVRYISTINRDAPSADYATKTIPATDPKDDIVQYGVVSEFTPRNLTCPNIVSIGAVEFVQQANKSAVYVDTQLSMDVAAMDLHALIREGWNDKLTFGKLDINFAETELRMLVYQMVNAVAYLHSKMIVHGDIKSQNFLVSATEIVPQTVVNHVLASRSNGATARTFKVVKLTDFGICIPKYMGDQDDTPRYSMGYRPPEYFNLTSDLLKIDPSPIPIGATPKCDVWALGCVLYELVWNTYPISATQIDASLPVSITTNEIATFNKMGKYESIWVQNCLNQIRMGRQTTKLAALEHAAYPGYFSMVISPMLAFHPCRRPTARDVLQGAYFTTAKHTIDAAADVTAALKLPLARPDYPYDNNSVLIPNQAVPILAQMQANKCPPAAFDTYLAIATEIKNTMDKYKTPSLWRLDPNEITPPLRFAVRMQALALVSNVAMVAGALDQLLKLGTVPHIATAFMVLAIQEAVPRSVVSGYAYWYTQPTQDKVFLAAVSKIAYEILRFLDCDVRRSTIHDFMTCLNQLPIKPANVELIRRLVYRLCWTPMITKYDSYTLVTLCIDFVMNTVNNIPLSTRQAGWWYSPTYPQFTSEIDAEIQLHCEQVMKSKIPY
jgi:serine/threonine protein kinase